MKYLKNLLLCIVFALIALFNSCSGSDDSTPASSSLISEPLHFSGTAIDASSITLNWEKPNTNADLVTFYSLKRDVGRLISPIDKNTFTFTDTNLVPNTLYTYTLHAEGVDDNKGTATTTTVKTKTQGTFTGKVNGIDYTFKTLTAKKINILNPIILIETEGDSGFGGFYFSIATEVKASTTYSCDETVNIGNYSPEINRNGLFVNSF